jgi:hypothetical protein
MMACTRSSWVSSTAASASFIWPAPGSMPSLLRGRLGLVGIEVLFGLLDEGQHVAHAQDAAGHPVGMEDVEVLELLAR